MNANRAMAELQSRDIGELVDQLKIAKGDPEQGDWGQTVFLIGAGCSHSAGIPLAGEIAQECVIELARKYSGQDFRERPVDALRWLYDNQKFKIDKYSEKPNWSRLYSYIFEEHFRSDTKQREIINRAIKRSDGRINWAHLCLGELVKTGYAHTVLTTNFDQLALQGIIYTGLLPVVADGLEALNRVSSKPDPPQIVYLHGSMHTYSPRSSTTAVQEVSDHLPMQGMLYQLLRDSQMLVVVGYGGGEEGIMELLIRAAEQFQNMQVYWAILEGESASLSSSTGKLLTKGHHKYLVEIRDADTLFAEIMEGLGLGVPQWMQDPAAVLERQGEAFAETENTEAKIRIETYRKEVAEIRRLAREAKEDEPEKDVIAVLRLEGKHEEALIRTRAMHDSNDSSIWQMSAGSAYELGQTREDTALLKESVESWQRVLELVEKAADEKTWAKAQNDLGKTLLAWAELEQQQEHDFEAVAAFEEAVLAFNAALEIVAKERDPLDWAEAQYNLGNTLQALGEAKNDLEVLYSAKSSYESALEVYTRERTSQFWATTQNNLGGVLQELGVKEKKSSHLESAITAHKAALSGYSREGTPVEWAGAQVNLAGTFFALYELVDRKDGNLLDESEAAYEAAAEAYEGASEVDLANDARTSAEEIRRLREPSESG